MYDWLFLNGVLMNGAKKNRRISTLAQNQYHKRSIETGRTTRSQGQETLWESLASNDAGWEDVLMWATKYIAKVRCLSILDQRSMNIRSIPIPENWEFS